MKRLTTVCFIVAALLFSVLPANASPVVFHGDVFSPTTPVFNVVQYGANPANSDNTTAFNNAIAAAAAKGGGTVFVPCSTTAYIILGALTVPYTGTNPVQPPIRITGCGPAWNGSLQGDITPTGSVLDMRYDGADGLHPAKIDLRGRGYFELDHLTLEDTSGHNFKFWSATNTTPYIHDVVFIGNTANSGTAVTQDAGQLGGDGYWGANVSTTNGSATLTCSDCSFTSSMVGWTITYSAAGVIDAGSSPEYSSTISAVNSATSVTLSSAATATISGGEANYFGTGTTDAQAPYQGYTARLVHNAYVHMCHAVDLGNYANGNVFADELFAYTSGCASSTGAWYQFDKASSTRLGNIFRAPQGEIQNYHYVAYAANDANQNVFENISPDDANANFVAGVYFGGGSGSNRVSIGAFTSYASSSVNTTIAAGFSAGSQTVTPASMTGITTSTKLLIDPDGSGVAEWVTPSATTGTTFTATFAHAHGSNIRVLGTVPAAAGLSYTLNSVFGNGKNAEGTVIPNATTLGGVYPTNAKTTITGAAVLPNTWVNQGMSLPSISDGGSLATALSNNAAMAFGSAGSLPPHDLLCYGNASSGSAYSCLGADGLNVASIAGSALSISNTGSIIFSFDTAGDFGAKGSINAQGVLLTQATGQNLILGNGGAGTLSYIKMSNASGAGTQYSYVGNGTSQFGASCGGVVPGVFAVAGAGGTAALCTDQAGNVGTNGTWNAPSGSATSCTGGYKFATSGLMVISGAGAPTCTAPAGSLYLRSDGASGSHLYISAGAGTWNAVSGV